MDSIQLLWKRIEAWLDRYAPSDWLRLAPGASEEEIQEAESAIGFALPEDVKASYRIHDGGYNIHIGFESLWSLKNMISSWQMMKNLREQNTWRDRDLYYFSDVVRASDWQTGPIQPLWWDLHWLPIQPDGAGNLLCIDLAPASGGKVGQIIDWDHECGPARVLFSSFQDLLSAFVDSLEGKVVTETVPGFPVFALDPENEDDEGDDIMEFRVRADGLQPQAVISKRVVVPARNLETTFASLLSEERAYLKEGGLQPSLSPPFVFVRYHEYRATGVDVEVGLPVMGEVAGREQITATYLPGGEVAVFKDKDVYDHSMLTEAFRAIEAWSKAYQRELLGMPWIVYFVNAQDPLALPNTSSLAEVYWLLKKGRICI